MLSKNEGFEGLRFGRKQMLDLDKITNSVSQILGVEGWYTHDM